MSDPQMSQPPGSKTKSQKPRHRGIKRRRQRRRRRRRRRHPVVHSHHHSDCSNDGCSATDNPATFSKSENTEPDDGVKLRTLLELVDDPTAANTINAQNELRKQRALLNQMNLMMSMSFNYVEDKGVFPTGPIIPWRGFASIIQRRYQEAHIVDYLRNLVAKTPTHITTTQTGGYCPQVAPSYAHKLGMLLCFFQRILPDDLMAYIPIAPHAHKHVYTPVLTTITTSFGDKEEKEDKFTPHQKALANHFCDVAETITFKFMKEGVLDLSAINFDWSTPPHLPIPDGI